MQNGHPIAYASRTLSETETKYAQIEKEMLAIVYAVEKLNDYTFGRKVTVYSDHKPLESILKKTLHRAPKRLQGMMIHLQKYDIEVKYVKGSNMFLADTLSRASIPGDGKSGPEFETINIMKYLPISDERDFFELDHLNNISSVHVIRKIKSHFAIHGIPEQVITDNGPQFVAHDFQIFAKEWDFEHVTCSPYHSQANGKAESVVKEAKKILRKSKKTKSDAFLAVLDHRNTPSASMKSSPAQRLLNRRARTLLQTTAKLLQPQSIDSGTTVKKLVERKRQQAKYYNREAVELK
ncbi:Retrovirus-related Pol poly from transposon [Paramuricea clavata]|uniref:Retrovirus-related Pol poly from transposon n=1 Tax=Paramuricea clavata TaxID=317549 RepID=A0A6S7J330_PARCT|nr:Retrovirus-related Pol poly from transposon [Paramuricea clavata]